MADKQKYGFIRGIWGTPDHQNRRRWTRLNKIHKDVCMAKLNPYEPLIKVYAFGEDNYKFMVDNGFDTKLVDKKCIVWNMDTEQYRHKIEVWNQGLQDFEQIIYLDWDCIPCCPIPEDIWEELGKGETLRGALYSYHRRKCFWQTEAPRTVMAATFIYLRGLETIQKIIEVWERNGRPWSEEVTLRKYIDEINGGWKGDEYYGKKYEPLYHTLGARWNEDFKRTRKMVFFHCNTKTIRILLGNKNKDVVKKNIAAFHKHRSEKLIISNG